MSLAFRDKPPFLAAIAPKMGVYFHQNSRLVERGREGSMRTSLAVFLTSFVLACGFLTSPAVAEISTGCCLPLPEAGCLDAVAPAACEEAGGWPFGACASSEPRCCSLPPRLFCSGGARR
jgi:hypothetical protein